MGRKTGEAKLSEKVIKYLKSLQEGGSPIFYEHRSGRGGFDYRKGIPDLYAVIDGVHIEIELKDVDGKRSAMQDKFKWRCENLWNIPYCCPHTFEEFVDFIKPLL